MTESSGNSRRDFGPDILIVDDDRPALKVLERGLRESGCQVRVASSGVEALRHCDDQAPELALLTIQLPDMPGRDVADDLRQRNIPFIFMSSHNDHEIVRHSIEMEAYGYLYKPIDAGNLVPVIKAALQRGTDSEESTPYSQSASFAAHTARETSVAIGVLMERHRLSAIEAFEALRRYSRSQRRKISEVAAQVVRATEELNISIKPTCSPVRRASDKQQK